MDEIEFGKCDICGVDSQLRRTYFKYELKCKCHSPYHFVLFRHCHNCVPVEPKEITIRTDNLVKI